MNVKRVIICLLCVVLAVSAAACKDNSSKKSNSSNETVAPMTDHNLSNILSGDDMTVIRNLFLLKLDGCTVEKCTKGQTPLKEGSTDFMISVAACVNVPSDKFEAVEKDINASYKKLDGFNNELETFNKNVNANIKAEDITGAYHRFDGGVSASKFSYTMRKIVVITKSGDNYKIYFNV